MAKNNEHIILEIYDLFFQEYGYQNWWPADSAFEVIVGAILTQSCSWHNVSLALNNLKKDNLLDPKKILNMKIDKFESLIKPSGYYKQKAKKIISFLKYFEIYDFDIDNIKKNTIEKVREELLNIWGIGEESADSILSYAFDKPMLVVDTYTKRFTYRLSLTDVDIKYSDLQKYLMDILPHDNEYYKDFHAQIVYHSKISCKKKPKCESCILRINNLCNYNI